MQIKLISFFWIIFLLILTTFLVFRNKEEGYVPPLAVVVATTMSEVEKDRSSSLQVNHNLPLRITIPKISFVSNI